MVDDIDDDAPPAPSRSVCEVFNPELSVGVACDHLGCIVGLHLGEEIYEHTDEWLAREILRVAKLARMKSQLMRRMELTANGSAPRLADSLGLPTEMDYHLLEKAEFGEV